MTHTIGMISLGCAKNQVNAEQMLYLLRQAGYEILPDPDGAEKIRTLLLKMSIVMMRFWKLFLLFCLK